MNSFSLSQQETNLPFSHIREQSSSQFLKNSTRKKYLSRQTCVIDGKINEEEKIPKGMMKTENRSEPNKISSPSKTINIALLGEESKKIVISKFDLSDNEELDFLESKYSK